MANGHPVQNFNFIWIQCTTMNSPTVFQLLQEPDKRREDWCFSTLALTLRALDRWWVGGASLDIQGGCLCWRQEGLDGAYVTRMTSDGSDSVPTLTTWPSPGVKPHKQRREGGGSLKGKPMKGKQRETLLQSPHDHFSSDHYSIWPGEEMAGIYNSIKSVFKCRW